MAEILERNRVFDVAQFNGNTEIYSRPTLVAVSYTHLTLPTNREV